MKKNVINFPNTILIIFVILFFSCAEQSNNTKNNIDNTRTTIATSQYEQKALEIVKGLPEVKDFMENNKNAIIEVDHIANDTIVVHVYKIVEHEDGIVTTGTLNWYNVDTKTWNVEKLF